MSRSPNIGQNNFIQSLFGYLYWGLVFRTFFAFVKELGVKCYLICFKDTFCLLHLLIILNISLITMNTLEINMFGFEYDNVSLIKVHRKIWL